MLYSKNLYIDFWDVTISMLTEIPSCDKSKQLKCGLKTRFDILLEYKVAKQVYELTLSKI